MGSVTTIAPLYDRILAQRVAAATHTTGAGLLIPEVARERPQEAIVIAVGCGKPFDQPIYDWSGVPNLGEPVRAFRAPIVKTGDRILISKYAGAEVRVGIQEYLILREDEVLGIVNTVEVPDEPVEEEEDAG